MLEEVKHVKSLGNNLPEQFLKCVWWVVVGGGVEKGEKNTKKKNPEPSWTCLLKKEKAIKQEVKRPKSP